WPSVAIDLITTITTWKIPRGAKQFAVSAVPTRRITGTRWFSAHRAPACELPTAVGDEYHALETTSDPRRRAEAVARPFRRDWGTMMTTGHTIRRMSVSPASAIVAAMMVLAALCTVSV